MGSDSLLLQRSHSNTECIHDKSLTKALLNFLEVDFASDSREYCLYLKAKTCNPSKMCSVRLTPPTVSAKYRLGPCPWPRRAPVQSPSVLSDERPLGQGSSGFSFLCEIAQLPVSVAVGVSSYWALWSQGPWGTSYGYTVQLNHFPPMSSLA